jgi:exodeoxyribonuclease VII large subunit
LTEGAARATTLRVSLFDDLPPPRAKRAEPREDAPAEEPLAQAPKPPKPPKPRGPEVVPVAQLTQMIAQRMADVGRVAVEGEVTAIKQAASGHMYFALKDEGARLDCKLWQSRVRAALSFELEEGARVVCHGKLDVYAPRGTYSLIVDRVERRGIGELLARLERLKAELQERGWFDRSRTWPALPQRIGVVTSRDADGWRDFLRTRTMRWPGYPLRMVHTRVQGAGAAREVAAAIERLDASGVDVICVVRGGGSLEDLWAFNELPVAEAIWRARSPVVTGVGHETDTTLADLVADHRAHTPTDAAQTVLPDRRALVERLERAGGYLVEAMERQLARRAERVERLIGRRTLRGTEWLLEARIEGVRTLARRLSSAGKGRLEREGTRVERLGGRLAGESPARRLAVLEARLAGLTPRLVPAGSAAIEARVRRADLAGRALEAVSPLAVLQRGYSITRTSDGRAVRSAGELVPGTRVESVLAGGVVHSDVVEVDLEGGA